MNYLLLGMIWVLSGLFVAYLMRQADEKEREGHYWIRGRSPLYSTFLLVLVAPLSLIFGILVVADYCSKK